MDADADWQLDCTELKQRGAHLLQSGQWADCAFLVGTEPHQDLISAHKLMLAMASPVFEAMFFGGMAERNDPVLILDVQPEAFKSLLEYIYTDNINISSFDKACELCYCAKKYMLPHLVKECTRYLWSDLYPRNACRAYEFALLFEENVLMEKCLQIISTNTKEVLNDSSFLDVELNTMITVFSLDHLNIDSELDLFEAAVRYAQALDKRTPEPSFSQAMECRPSPGPSSSKDKEKVVNIEESSAENSPLGAGGEAAANAEVAPIAEASTKSGGTETTNEEAPTTATVTGTNSGTSGGTPSAAANNSAAAGTTPSATATNGISGVSSATPATGKAGEEAMVEEGEVAGENHDDQDGTKKIRSAIEKIRFLTLTPQQFAEGPARSSLLSESESFAVLMNILSSNSDVSLPTGFSSCRVPRKQLIGGDAHGSNNTPTFTVDTPSPVGDGWSHERERHERLHDRYSDRPLHERPLHAQRQPSPWTRHPPSATAGLTSASATSAATTGYSDRPLHERPLHAQFNERLLPIYRHLQTPTFTVDTPSPVGDGWSHERERHERLHDRYSDRPLHERPLHAQFNERFGERAEPPPAHQPMAHPSCLSYHQRPSRFDGVRLHSAVHAPMPGLGMNMSVPLGDLLGAALEPLERVAGAMAAELNKIYCQRAIIQQTDCLNTSVLDCSVTFMVDKNICLLGVQVPTQAPSEESVALGVGGAGVVGGANAGYSELLYAHLLDADGARLTYTHYTSRVPYRHLLDIMFNRPVYIQRNKVYKVGIVFNKVGWYPLGTCAQQVAAESVFFNFGIGQSSDSVRDGLIRSIIFTY